MSNHVRFEAYLEKHRGTPSDATPAKVRENADETFHGSAYRGPDGENNALAHHEGSGEIEDLINVARGAALILSSMWEYMEDGHEQAVISGLASALRNAVEPADAYFFESVGDLNKRLRPRHLVHLLEKQLEDARRDVAAEEAILAAKKANYDAKYKGQP
jgi:hypothetical protein